MENEVSHLRRLVCRLKKSSVWSSSCRGVLGTYATRIPDPSILFQAVKHSCHVMFFISFIVLVVYIDAFKFAGPTKGLKRGWDLVRVGLSIKPEFSMG